MAKIKRTKASKKKAAPKRFLGKTSIELPMEPSARAEDLRDYSLLIHGEKKIGKTSMLAQEPDALFIEFDPPQKALSILQIQGGDWKNFKGILAELEKECAKAKPRYRTIVIDGVDIMYRQCFSYTCKRLGITHPSDVNDFGASWGHIKTEFSDAVDRLLKLPNVAVRWLSHSKWTEVKSRMGLSFEKLTPYLSGQAEEALVGPIDIWAAYVYNGKERVLVVKGDEMTGAGHRLEHHFLTPDGRMVEEIPLGRSPQEAYANVVAAFENRQTFVNLEERKEGAKKKVGKKVLKKAVKKKFLKKR